ncbi:hypothetical protein FRC14_005757 [Serendipita sp. 396]|nr:hypothetical protein FRC14_005757 [Serendipita sp. 396]KAG8770546.1 hypothetical protein FRC15_004030 [Serendipita sp. 397]KAG8828398.1 hypothetical protein FRC19_006496 [Serendipita sp. 401]KAG9058494.1 hypothetical protein FS842_008791 [Serendipita sp. 407]
MRATQAIEDKDVTLEALMEDYIRASEFQLSLRRRIEAVIREKEEQAKQEEGSAQLALLAAEQNVWRLKEAHRILKERMRKAAGVEDDELTHPRLSGDPAPASVRSATIELSPTGGTNSCSSMPSILPPSPLRPPSRPTTPPVYVMPNLAPVVGPFNPSDAMEKDACRTSRVDIWEGIQRAISRNEGQPFESWVRLQELLLELSNSYAANP